MATIAAGSTVRWRWPAKNHAETPAAGNVEVYLASAPNVGDDYPATIRVSGPADREQERYPLLEESLELDLSGLSADDLTRLLTVVERAVDQVCTVGRTLKTGTKVNFEVKDVGGK